MKWPWQQRGDSEADHARADAALELSQQQREKGTELAEEARRRAARWRHWRRENHFADGFKNALGDGR